MICFDLNADALDDVDRVRVRQNEDAHENRFLAGEADFGVVVFGAENDIGDIAEPNECALVLLNHQLLELVGRVQVGVRGQVHLKERTLGAADGGQVIVPRKRSPDITRADVEGGHAFRFHPNAHGESASAENVGFLHAADRGQARLDQADEIIGHFVRLQNIRGETQVSGSDLRIGGLNRDHRDLRLGRQIVADRVHSRADIGERLVRVEVELQPRRDRGDALLARATGCSRCHRLRPWLARAAW